MALTMTWSDVFAMCGVLFTLVSMSVCVAFREDVLPLFIGSNCTRKAAGMPETDESDEDIDDREVDWSRGEVDSVYGGFFMRTGSMFSDIDIDIDRDPYNESKKGACVDRVKYE
jgi:hypothetical protein